MKESSLNSNIFELILLNYLHIYIARDPTTVAMTTSPLEAVNLGPICTFNTNKMKRKWRSLVNFFSIYLSYIDNINSYFYELQCC